MHKFVNINGTNELIEYLKGADSEFLATQYPFDFLKTLAVPWAPTIESSNSINAFLTQTPHEIYNSDRAPALDVMFNFNSKVIDLPLIPFSSQFLELRKGNSYRKFCLFVQILSAKPIHWLRIIGKNQKLSYRSMVSTGTSIQKYGWYFIKLQMNLFSIYFICFRSTRNL